MDFVKHLKKWSVFIELLMELVHDSMTVDDDRHWTKIRKLLNADITMHPDSELHELWKLNIQKYEEKLKDIGEQSKQEDKMKIAIDKIEVMWETAEFVLM